MGRRRRWIGTTLGALALLLGVGWLGVARRDGPWGPIPGGRLHGRERPCPIEAAPFAAVHAVELEVSPDRPRSVRIWSVVVDDRLFVPGDFLTPMKRWPAQVVADPRVRIRIDGQLYRCRARRVTDPATVEALRRETARKYRIEPDGWAARSEVWWFELGPRLGDMGPQTAPTASSERSRNARPPGGT
ncbi:MAG: hypothetical protein R3F35_22680 [Myxococcota bacterium]